MICVTYGCFGCDYYYQGPINFAFDNRIGDIVVGEILDISFDLRFNQTCTSDYCSLFRITGNSAERVPWINIPAVHNRSLKAVFSDSIAMSSGPSFSHTPLNNTYNNGKYHRYYFKWSKTERIFIYDNTVYKNITNGNYDSSQYINKQYGIYIIEDNANNINIHGTISNLCINSSWYKDTDPIQCDQYFKNPIYMSPRNYIGDVIIQENIEISFDLQIETGYTCNDEFCHIFNIGVSTGFFPRFPLLALRANGDLHVSFTNDNNITHKYDIDDVDFKSSINDGNYHRYYFKFSRTERIFIYDFNNTYKNETNVYDHSQYYGDKYGIYAFSNDSGPTIKANIKNLCVGSYNTTLSPTMYPSNSPTDSAEYPTYFPIYTPIYMPTNTSTDTPTERLTTIADKQTSFERDNLIIYILVGMSVLCIVIFIGYFCFRFSRKRRLSVQDTTGMSQIQMESPVSNEEGIQKDNTNGEHFQSHSEELYSETVTKNAKGNDDNMKTAGFIEDKVDKIGNQENNYNEGQNNESDSEVELYKPGSTIGDV
eukprot:57657_1